ncbi:hypothetical protein FACS1894191_8010 [Clostridia bacterium]|nr:hypothetical protein FACS1894191_8010 [Clostridia bacterium]
MAIIKSEDVNSVEQRPRWDEDAKAEFALVNANEELVVNIVKNMMQFVDMCKCEKCFKDTCAIVLNRMSPQYVTTHKGSMLSQLPQMEMMHHAEITIMVVQALKIVGDSPQH